MRRQGWHTNDETGVSYFVTRQGRVVPEGRLLELIAAVIADNHKMAKQLCDAAGVTKDDLEKILYEKPD